MFSYELLLLERINCSHKHDNNNYGVRIIDLIDVYAKPAFGLQLDLFDSQVHLNTLVLLSDSAGHVQLGLGKSLLEAKVVGHPDSLLVQDFHCGPRLDMPVMSS